jgi:ketosteroid isomerase-like protein
MSDLAQRLDVLETRARLADLVHAYAKAVREGDFAAMAPLFTKDGAFRVLEADASGAMQVHTEVIGGQALADFYAKTLRKGEIYPLVYDLMFEIDGNQATSSCVMTGAAADGTAKFMGVYHDEYRREADWLFTGRTFTIVSWGQPKAA